MTAQAGQSAEVSGPRATWVVVLLTVFYALAFLDRQILALMVEPIRASLNINDFEYGLLQGFAFAFFYATFGIPLGWMADRYSRRWIITWGVAFWGAAAFACGLATKYWHLLLARFAVGAGEASLNPAAFSLLSSIFPPQRLAFAMSVFGAGALIGSALAIGGAGVLLDHLPAGGVALPLIGGVENWQLVFMITGIPGVFIAWLALTLPEPKRPRVERQSFGGAFARIIKERRFYIGHALGFGFNSLCGYGVLLWSPAYLLRRFDLSHTEVGLSIAFTNVATGFAGALLCGALVDRWFSRGTTDAHLKFFGYTALIQGALVVIAVAMPTPLLFIAFMCLHQIFASFTGVASAALQIVTPSEYRGQISAVYLFTLNLIGFGCGPAVVAAFTTYLFRDDVMVGWAIALTCVIFLPLSFIALRWACAPMRRLVNEQGAAPTQA